MIYKTRGTCSREIHIEVENDIITDFGWKTPIYVDLSIGQNNLCFDNHRTFIPNSNRVNPNVIQREYFNKYNLISCGKEENNG